MEIRKALGKEKIKGVKVTTVDNYQGEENCVVILSCVRCNDQDKIGIFIILAIYYQN
jgi:superfamily I DNA and/or RNA helicase